MALLDRDEKLVARGVGFRVYTRGGVFFVDTGRNPISGYNSLQGVAEYLYYQGYIDDKTISALGRVYGEV